jgi:hypothetical protein
MTNLEQLRAFVAERNEETRSSALFFGDHDDCVAAMSRTEESRLILREIDRLIAERPPLTHLLDSMTREGDFMLCRYCKNRLLSDEEFEPCGARNAPRPAAESAEREKRSEPDCECGFCRDGDECDWARQRRLERESVDASAENEREGGKLPPNVWVSWNTDDAGNPRPTGIFLSLDVARRLAGMARQRIVEYAPICKP